MSALSFLGNVYVITIIILSFIVALTMSLQTQNEWYLPQHPVCNSVEYSIEACSNSEEYNIEISVPPTQNEQVILFRDSNGESLVEINAGRTETIAPQKASTFEIVPHKDSYKCSRESTIIRQSEITSC